MSPRTCSYRLEELAYMRMVFASSVPHNSVVIGRAERTVKVYESRLSRRKFKVGRVYNQQWVFGGICREDKDCFLYIVLDRTAETLLEIIRA